MMRTTLSKLQAMHVRGEKIAVLTCYDASFATLLENNGVDVLLIDRGDYLHLLPASDFTLAAGDHLLFASSLAVLTKLKLALQNANELDYVLDGIEDSGSWVWQWLRRRQQPAGAARR